jgi:hypothetical protein
VRYDHYALSHRTDDADNIDYAIGYLEQALPHVKVLVENTRDTDNMAATRLQDLIEQALDVLENGY